MSLKGSKTTADYLPWNDMLVLVGKLQRKEEYDFSTLIVLGSYTGLRISDIRKLRWKDLVSPLKLVEQKTHKERVIHLHDDLLYTLGQIRQEVCPLDTDLVFDYSLQYTNRKLKKIALEYGMDIRFSTHSMRKTFGRRIWSKNNYSEKSLILLSQVFNHSSVSITKRYLGIREEEIQNVYMNM
jgi:integrase